MTIKNNIRESDRRHLHDMLDEILEGEAGFIFFFNGKKTLDFYQGIHPDCVIHIVTDSVHDFQKTYQTLPEKAQKGTK